MRSFLALFSFLAAVACFAQPDLVREFEKTVSSNKPSLLFRLDTRNSFITNSRVKITGIQLGASFGETLKLGMGYNFLGRRSASRLEEEFFEDPSSELKLEYGTFFIEYRFYRKNRFSASMPLRFGLGTISFRQQELERHRTIVLYEAMLCGEFKILKYIGLGGGLGYRLALLNNRSFGLNLNSPVYNLKFNLYFQQLYSDLAKK